MSLWIDGLGYQGNSTILSKSWVLTNAPTIAFDTGRLDGRALVYSSDNAAATVARTFTSIPNVALGFAFKSSVPVNNKVIVRLQRNNLDVCYMSVHRVTIGDYYFMRLFNKNGLIGESAPLRFKFDDTTWNYIEIEFASSETVGKIDVYLNSERIFHVPVVDNTTSTNLTGVDRFVFPVAGGDTNKFYLDDFYYQDSAVRLRECHIATLLPNSTVKSQWIRNGGFNNHDRVNSGNFGSPNGFVLAPNAAAEDIYGLQNLNTVTSTTGTINGVIVRTYAFKDFEFTASMINELILGATTVQSTPVAIGATLSNATVFSSALYPNNISTGQPWTQTDINNLSLGIKTNQ